MWMCVWLSIKLWVMGCRLLRTCIGLVFPYWGLNKGTCSCPAAALLYPSPVWWPIQALSHKSGSKNSIVCLSRTASDLIVPTSQMHALIQQLEMAEKPWESAHVPVIAAVPAALVLSDRAHSSYPHLTSLAVSLALGILRSLAALNGRYGDSPVHRAWGRAG